MSNTRIVDVSLNISGMLFDLSANCTLTTPGVYNCVLNIPDYFTHGSTYDFSVQTRYLGTDSSYCNPILVTISPPAPTTLLLGVNLQGLDNAGDSHTFDQMMRYTTNNPSNGTNDAIINLLNLSGVSIIRIPITPTYMYQIACPDGICQNDPTYMTYPPLVLDPNGVPFFQPWNNIVPYTLPNSASAPPYGEFNPTLLYWIPASTYDGLPGSIYTPYGSSTEDSDIRRGSPGGILSGPNFVLDSGNYWSSFCNSGNFLQGIYKAQSNGMYVIIDMHAVSSNLLGFYDFLDKTTTSTHVTINPTYNGNIYSTNNGFIYLWLTHLLIINNKWNKNNWELAFGQFGWSETTLNNYATGIFDGSYEDYTSGFSGDYNPNLIIYPTGYTFNPSLSYLELHNEPINTNGVDITPAQWSDIMMSTINAIRYAELALSLVKHNILISTYGNYSGLHNYTDSTYGLSNLLNGLSANNINNSETDGVYFSVHQYCDNDWSGTHVGLSDESFNKTLWTGWISTLENALITSTTNYKILFTEGNIVLNSTVTPTSPNSYTHMIWWGNFLRDLSMSPMTKAIVLWSDAAGTFSYNSSPNNSYIDMFPGFTNNGNSQYLSSNFNYYISLNEYEQHTTPFLVTPSNCGFTTDITYGVIPTWYNNYYLFSTSTTETKGCYKAFKIDDSGNSIFKTVNATNLDTYNFTSIENLVQYDPNI